MNISDAEKTVINGLTQKDESTIASTDLVQLYAQDGTPNGKISKADLMDAVKASLPALLSDGSTNGGSVLSIIDGALKTRTDANLASVLGVLVNRRTPISGEPDMDANNCFSTGFYYITTSGSVPYTDIHLPTGSNIVIFVFNPGEGYCLQMGVEQTGKLFYRVLTDRTSTWTTWKEL